MTQTAEQERAIPPKRQRMLDMIMVLGGLKEEQAIPLSRVNEEIETLKGELTPLTSKIIAFPDRYCEEFLAAAEKSQLGEQVIDQGVLSEAIGRLQRALEVRHTEAVKGLLDLLHAAQQRLAEDSKTSESGPPADMHKIISPLPKIVEEIEGAIEEYERERQQRAEEALQSLREFATEFQRVAGLMSESPEEALNALQKLGTKVRYGPFLRNAVQIKRALKEGRLTSERFAELVRTNMRTEMIRGLVLFVLGNVGPKTVLQLSDVLDLDPRDVQQAIITMIQRNEIEMVGIEGDAPVYGKVMGSVPDATLVVKRVVQQMRALRRMADEETQSMIEATVKRLSSCLEKLQRLGQYDATSIADKVDAMRKTADDATEAALSTQGTTDTEELQHLIAAGLEAFARFRLKITLEKGPSLVEGTNVYGEKLDPEVYKKIMDTYLENEIERGFILVLIREQGAMTVKELSEKTKIPPDRVLQHVLRMKRDELLTLAGEKEGYVLYDVPRTPNEAEVAIETISTLIQDLAPAIRDLDGLVKELTPKDIGRLVNTLEVFSKARDKMAKITLGGAVIAADAVEEVKETIKSALAMAYRTRARIPSTRPKVTIEDLMDVDVPTVMDEYKDMMGYAPLLGFGTIEWDQSKCLGCKSCELVCPEDAIFLRPVIEVSKFFEFNEEVIDKFPTVRAILLKTIRGLAVNRPREEIVLERDAPGFGKIEVDLWLCVACRTCVRRCPGVDDGALELDLRWSLPEVIRHLVSQGATE